MKMVGLVFQVSVLSRWGSIAANVSAMRSAGLRGTHYQTTQAYERGRTLDITNKPALRISGCYTQAFYG
jgi:hypothetical protein